MKGQLESVQRRSPNRYFFILGGAASGAAGLALLTGLIVFCAVLLNPNAAPGWPGTLQSNWLVKIFISHAGLETMGSDLHGINPLDIAFLLLTGAAALAASQALHGKARIWCILAAGLAAAGLMLYLATQLTGRSTVMLVAMILSFVLRKNQIFPKFTAIAGVSAGALLLLGDFTVGVQSAWITILFGVGYLLLMGWFFLMAAGFHRLRRA